MNKGYKYGRIIRMFKYLPANLYKSFKERILKVHDDKFIENKD